MNERFTEKDVRLNFDRLAKQLGKKTESEFPYCRDEKGFVLGCWRLDYNPIYGGYAVEEIMNEAGGVDMPLGMRRSSPKEFVEKIWFAEKVLQAMK